MTCSSFVKRQLRFGGGIVQNPTRARIDGKTNVPIGREACVKGRGGWLDVKRRGMFAAWHCRFAPVNGAASGRRPRTQCVASLVWRDSAMGIAFLCSSAS